MLLEEKEGHSGEPIFIQQDKMSVCGSSVFHMQPQTRVHKIKVLIR